MKSKAMEVKMPLGERQKVTESHARFWPTDKQNLPGSAGAIGDRLLWPTIASDACWVAAMEGAQEPGKGDATERVSAPAPPAEEGGISLHNFCGRLAEHLVHFHAMRLQDSLFLWVGDGPELSNLAVAMCTPRVSSGSFAPPGLHPGGMCVCKGSCRRRTSYCKVG